MVDIDFYCRVYDNFLEPDVCQAYIDMFEETLTVDADKHQRLSVCYDQNGDKVCGDCDCYRTNPFEFEFHDRVQDCNHPHNYALST